MAAKGKGILLEAGTNELEILVFTLGTQRCGVNVAKVREVIGMVKPIRMPQAHPAVLGCANLRGKVIPLVDLQLYFHPDQPSTCEQRHIIITEFNDMVVGFVVDGVEQIYRQGWETIEPLPSNHTNHCTAINSICHIDDDLVLMIDFEKIALEIAGVSVEAQDVGQEAIGCDRSTKHLLLAEDSATMRGFIYETLVKSGYTNAVAVSDGAQAWQRLLESLEEGNPRFDLLISDIEMPQMDGLHLTKRLREHPELKQTPVVIFSSLVSHDNLKKMEAVGADATLTKPQLVDLVQTVDRLLFGGEAG